MPQIFVACFGDWQVTVDGVPVRPIRSRAARELLVYMSLRTGPVPREEVIDDLWPTEGDQRRGRRRLSQELSRIQSAVGTPMWVGGRDLVDVVAGCLLDSDVAEFARGASSASASVDLAVERARLACLIRIPARGRLLAGHYSDWAVRLQASSLTDEVRLLDRAVRLYSSVQGATALGFARRWTELAPLDDRANAALVELIRTMEGPEAAVAQLDEIDRRYEAELGAGAPELIRKAAKGPTAPAPGLLWAEMGELRAAMSAVCSPDDERRLLVAIDDRLRMTGHHKERTSGIDRLGCLGHDPDDLRWRWAEVLVSRNEWNQVRSLIEQAETVDPRLESHALLLLTQGRWAATSGSLPSAIRVVDQVIANTRSTLVATEAHILAGRLLDQSHDLEAADARLQWAYEEAQSHGLRYHRALALCTQGWVRVNADDDNHARTLLTEAVTEARVLGSTSIEATALGTLAYLHSRAHRPGSALDAILMAVELAERMGDVHAQLRWRLNAAVYSLSIGDSGTARVMFDTVLAACERTHVPPPFWAKAIESDLVALETPDQERALRLLDEQLELSVAHGVGLLTFATMVEMVEKLRRVERVDDALAIAIELSAMVDEGRVADHWRNAASAYLGAALMWVGRAAEGLPLLRKAATGPRTALPNPHHLYLWHYEAAAALGLKGEARTAAARGYRHVLMLKADLSEDRWRMAVEKVPAIARLYELGTLAGEVNRLT